MKHIALIGNATWLNRGCEAIELSTIALVQSAFGGGVRFTVVPLSDGDPRESCEGPEGVGRSSPPDFELQRWSLDWLLWRAARALGTGHEYRALVSAYRRLDALSDAPDAILSVGGDNYSNDYGRPVRFWALNEYGRFRGIPVYLWGASVGPFESEVDQRIAVHSLQRVRHIFARESDTLDYLASLGVRGNVSLVADPAFTLPAVSSEALGAMGAQGECIGLNVSPLYARYAGLAEAEWCDLCATMVARIGAAFGRPIALIPHVILPGQDDSAFNVEVAARVPSGVDLRVIPGSLGARELKACIARCYAFVGARTHATIAALSTGVPTVSLGYSIKARGINRDIYGHSDYVIAAEAVEPTKVVGLVRQLLQDQRALSALHAARDVMPGRAAHAASLLRTDLEALS